MAALNLEESYLGIASRFASALLSVAAIYIGMHGRLLVSPTLTQPFTCYPAVRLSLRFALLGDTLYRPHTLLMIIVNLINDYGTCDNLVKLDLPMNPELGFLCYFGRSSLCSGVGGEG